MGVPQDRRGVGRGVINNAFEYHRVRICDGVCDSADLCGRSDCEFYDISEEATRRFLQTQAKEHTLEGKFPTIH